MNDASLSTTKTKYKLIKSAVHSCTLKIQNFYVYISSRQTFMYEGLLIPVSIYETPGSFPNPETCIIVRHADMNNKFSPLFFSELFNNAETKN